MNKVININFQGRVIPIEETAYEMLKQYIESLRRYFAQEEGKDEIINDIENRIAELFDENLKKGAVCITDLHVNAVMASMGRPEDFEEQDAQYAGSSSGSQNTGNAGTQAGFSQASAAAEEPKRLTRAENDKVLGGVCAGVAHYFRIDPAVVRIIFALVAFGGFGFGVLLYIVLWAILPAKPLQSNVRKRLYRDADNKMIGGVASGLSAYFNIDTWIPRLIFLLPFLLSFLPNLFNWGWGRWHGPWVAFSGLGGTFFVTYIILWIVLPKAVTASEKLEMRGEKIDLESIKNTVQEELQSVKGRAEKAGAAISERATAMGQEISKVAQEKSQQFASEIPPMARKAGTGIGEAIGVLFKAFFLGIAGIVAFSLLAALIALLFSGVAVLPLKNFLLDGFWENFLAWSVLALFIGVPIVAIVVWIVRKMMGVKSKSPYLGYVFGSLWIIGIISFLTLASMVARDFRYVSDGDDSRYAELVQPANGGLVIKSAGYKKKYYSYDFFEGELPFLSYNGDSMLLNTVRVKIVKSKDSLYHVNFVSFARGKSPMIAEKNAADVQLEYQQQDSVLTLAHGFAISQNNKFRNQQVLVLVAVPVGKKIMVDRSVNRNYDWFNINVNRRRGINVEDDDRWENSYSWSSNVQYIMTSSGLERIDGVDSDERRLKSGKFKLKTDENGVEIEVEGDLEDENGNYRYRKGKGIRMEKDRPRKPKEPKAPEDPEKPATPVTKLESKQVTERNATEKRTRQYIKGEPDSDLHSPFAFLTGR